MLPKTADLMDRLLDYSGKAFSWLPLLLILIQFAVVMLVYVFKAGSIQLQESLQYINAVMFLGGAGYTALKDGHVRVDLFYSGFTDPQKAMVNFYGTLFLLVPFLSLFWISTLPYALESWRIMETSVESSGLPFVYILKTTLILFPLTLSLHVFTSLIRNYSAMRAK